MGYKLNARPGGYEGRKDINMGLLYERTCGHCKHLIEALTCGVCEVTDHRVIYTGDDDFAEQCPLYENKYGYTENKE